MFSPLAYTKTFAMAGAALLSITLVPALMWLFIRGRVPPEQSNPIVRVLIWLYRPVIAWALRWRKFTLVAAAVVLAATAFPATRLGTEFMPTLNEGTLFYMPATLPSLSVTKAAEILQAQDRIIKSFPEVASVFGKAGRANTATDPAPTEMFRDAQVVWDEGCGGGVMATRREKQLIDDFIEQLRMIAEYYTNSSKEAVWTAHEDKIWNDTRKKLEELIDEATYREELDD